MDLGGHEGGGGGDMPIASSYSALHESAKMKMLTSGNGSGNVVEDMNVNTTPVSLPLLRPLPLPLPLPLPMSLPPLQQQLDNNNNNNNSSSGATPKALPSTPTGGGPGPGPGPGPGAAAAAAAAGAGTGNPAASSVKKAVRYRECHKNHAASIGGHAIDGCGEFMPLGEEGSLDALKCAACDCHRNFHRREVEGEPSCDCHNPLLALRNKQKQQRPGSGGGGGGGAGGGVVVPGGPSPGVGAAAGAVGLATPSPLPLPSSLVMPRNTPAPILMALSSTPGDSDEQEGGLGSASPAAMKKRFRTKFSTEQKEKMCSFADKLGWKIQKHDEAAVQQFCADVGVKRHVLKVWMHNNKHTLGKKL